MTIGERLLDVTPRARRCSPAHKKHNPRRSREFREELMKNFIAQLAFAVAAMFCVIGTALAEKKVIRINHAGADDIVGTEHQLYAWIFGNYLNE